jgi:type II secretory pathway component PulF
VVIFGIIMGAVFVGWIMPALVGVLEQLGVDLPFITKLMLKFTAVISSEMTLLALAVIIAGCALAIRTVWPGLRATVEPVLFRLLESVPYLGRIFSRLEQSRLLSALGSMLDAGLPINEIILLLRTVPRHPDRVVALGRVYTEVLQGRSTTEMFCETRLFEATVSHLLVAGEESGDIAHMAHRSSVMLEQELERDTETLISLLEPLLMAILGALALFFLLSAFLPLVQVLNSFVSGL